MNETYYCSFCGKSQHETSILIAGPLVFICDECVELCRDIVGAKRQKHPVTLELPLKTDVERKVEELAK